MCAHGMQEDSLVEACLWCYCWHAGSSSPALVEGMHRSKRTMLLNRSSHQSPRASCGGIESQCVIIIIILQIEKRRERLLRKYYEEKRLRSLKMDVNWLRAPSIPWIACNCFRYVEKPKFPFFPQHWLFRHDWLSFIVGHQLSLESIAPLFLRVKGRSGSQK